MGVLEIVLSVVAGIVAVVVCIVAVLTYCDKMITNRISAMKENIENRVKGVVYTDVCNATQQGVVAAIDALRKHFDTRFADLMRSLSSRNNSPE